MTLTGLFIPTYSMDGITEITFSSDSLDPDFASKLMHLFGIERGDGLIMTNTPEENVAIIIDPVLNEISGPEYINYRATRIHMELHQCERVEEHRIYGPMLMFGLEFDSMQILDLPMETKMTVSDIDRSCAFAYEHETRFREREEQNQKERLEIR